MPRILLLICILLAIAGFLLMRDDQTTQKAPETANPPRLPAALPLPEPRAPTLASPAEPLPQIPDPAPQAAKAQVVYATAVAVDVSKAPPLREDDPSVPKRSHPLMPGPPPKPADAPLLPLQN